MDIVCFNEFSHKYAACKSYIVNIIPFLKLISIITENSVRKDWVAQLKGLFRETHCRRKKKQGSMLNGDVLDNVSRRGISSGSTRSVGFELSVFFFINAGHKLCSDDNLIKLVL